MISDERVATTARAIADSALANGVARWGYDSKPEAWIELVRAALSHLVGHGVLVEEFSETEREA